MVSVCVPIGVHMYEGAGGCRLSQGAHAKRLSPSDVMPGLVGLVVGPASSSPAPSVPPSPTVPGSDSVIRERLRLRSEEAGRKGKGGGKAREARCKVQGARGGKVQGEARCKGRTGARGGQVKDEARW